MSTPYLGRRTRDNRLLRRRVTRVGRTPPDRQRQRGGQIAFSRPSTFGREKAQTCRSVASISPCSAPPALSACRASEPDSDRACENAIAKPPPVKAQASWEKLISSFAASPGDDPGASVATPRPIRVARSVPSAELPRALGNRRRFLRSDPRADGRPPTSRLSRRLLQGGGTCRLLYL